MAIIASKDTPLPDDIASTFRRLPQSAVNLNVASNGLGKAIALSDDNLRTLNLGISAWIVIAEDLDQLSDNYWRTSLGYDNINGKWGIALRTESGDLGDPNGAEVQSWLFNDGPRALRLEAMPKLPHLFEEIVKQADEMTAKIKTATLQAEQFAAVLAGLIPPTPPATKQGSR
ncbi:MAG: hypothetical protein ABJA98_20735 [Acidobacteriota bacterium]